MRPLRRHQHPGVTTVYTVLALTVLFGFCSLGADYGRVQLVKTELQRAADAAARAAASAIPSGITEVQDIAVAYAALNTADGSAVTLNASTDVEFGTWDSSSETFTVLTGSARSSANAIRITARRTAASGNAVPLLFGKLIGIESCDVRASAISQYTAATGAGFVGLDKLEFGNNATIYAYNSNTGSPGGSNLLPSAQLGGNGDIEFGNNADIYGNLVKGPSADLDHGNHFYISGNQSTLPSNLSYTATESSTVASSGALTRGNNSTLTLSAGTYCYSSITFGNSGTINCTGPVTIYLNGNLNVGNNFRISAYQDKPANVRLRVIGNRDFNTGNDPDLEAEIYGPQSELNVGNNATFKGSAVVKEFQAGNNADLFYDTALGNTGSSSGAISTVK